MDLHTGRQFESEGVAYLLQDLEGPGVLRIETAARSLDHSQVVFGEVDIIVDFKVGLPAVLVGLFALTLLSLTDILLANLTASWVRVANAWASSRFMTSLTGRSSSSLVRLVQSYAILGW